MTVAKISGDIIVRKNQPVLVVFCTKYENALHPSVFESSFAGDSALKYVGGLLPLSWSVVDSLTH